MESRRLAGRPWDNQVGAMVSCEPKTQFDAMKTQFRRNTDVKCLTDKNFPSRPKTQLQPNSVMPRHRTLWLVTQRIRRVPPIIYRQFADEAWEFADSADFGFVESTDNLPIFARNLPILARVELRNPSIIHRRCDPIHRSGCRNQSVESTDNRQMISGNRQIPSPMDRPSGPRNYRLIVNRFPVIVNSAAWNLSTIHQQDAEIYHRADRPPAIRLLESSDNHPMTRRNHPTDSANLPTNFRDLPILPCEQVACARFSMLIEERAKNQNGRL